MPSTRQPATRDLHLVVTHAHSDHIAGAPAILERRPSTTLSKMPWPIRDRDLAWTPLADGDAIETGEGTLQVVHTPGHAPDHICLWHAASRTAVRRRHAGARDDRGDSRFTRRQRGGRTSARSTACCGSTGTRAARARTGDRGSAGADPPLHQASRRARGAGAGGAASRRGDRRAISCRESIRACSRRSRGLPARACWHI